MDQIDKKEDIEKKRKRLIFRSWHRGTREMDLLLGSFADRHLSDFSDIELNEYEDVLNCSDPELYGWITGQNEPPANLVTKVLKKVISHKFVG